MFLLLGHSNDSCCLGVRAELASHDLDARIVAAPLAPPARLTWRLDAAGLTSSLFPPVPDTAISGVLVRDTGWLDPAGWEEDDFDYMQAELRAVMLAWLAGLSCPVINRPDAALWYRAGAPLVAWRPLLRRVGLPLPEVVITSDPAEAAAFRRRLAADGVAGAVYAPLTNASGYLLADDDAWDGLVAVQATDAGLPHRAARCRPCSPASSVTTVIWDGAQPAEVRRLDGALRRFATAAASVVRRNRGRAGPRRPRRRAGRASPAARALRRAGARAHLRRARRGAHDEDSRRRGRRADGAVVILVCGGLADGVTELVCSRLQDCGYPYRLLDFARFPDGYRLSVRWTDDGPQGWIATDDWRLDLDDISGVYARFLGPDDRAPLPGLDPADATALRTEADLGLMALLEDLGCPVVNRIGGGLSNNSKPYQALVISRAGLRRAARRW